MAFISLDDPYVSCAVCFRRIRVPMKVLTAPSGAGAKHTVRCECGALWGFDNYPALRPYRPPRKDATIGSGSHPDGVCTDGEGKVELTWSEVSNPHD